MSTRVVLEAQNVDPGRCWKRTISIKGAVRGIECRSGVELAVSGIECRFRPVLEAYRRSMRIGARGIECRSGPVLEV